MSFSLALFATAALHAPWWGKIIALLLTAASLGAWGLTTTAVSSTGSSIAVLAFIAGLVVWYLVRIRRRFAWWEFPVSLVLVSGPVLLGLYSMRAGRASGFEFAPQALLQTVDTLAYLVLPAAISAGVAVAEIAVRAATVTINLLDPAGEPAGACGTRCCRTWSWRRWSSSGLPSVAGSSHTWIRSGTAGWHSGRPSSR